MGNNRSTDKLLVRNVTEMHTAGDTSGKIGEFFHHSRQWADYILQNYSSGSFSPLVVNKRGTRRKTTEEEDAIIVQTGEDQLHEPVRVVLAQLNSPIKAKVSRQTV